MKNEDTICPVCGEYYFELPDDYDICPICGWENDGLQRSKKDFWGGANSLSANEARKVYILSKNEETKSEVSKIVEKYYQRNREINVEFRDVDHRTIQGEKCRVAFAIAHNEFVFELEKL